MLDLDQIRELLPIGENTRTPFHGRPKTLRGTSADGSPNFVVIAVAPTPMAARAARWLGLLAGAGLFAGEAILAFGAWERIRPAGWLFLAFAPFVMTFAAQRGLMFLLQSRRVIRFDLKGVVIEGLFETRRHPLDLPLRFSLIPHDKERIEQEWVGHVSRFLRPRWWMPRWRTYLDKSAHLSLDHYEQRNDIMTIYGRARARRIQARLNACLEMVRDHGRAGRGAAFEARDDWSRQPGELLD